MSADEFTAICQDFFDRLGEHADAVQVLASFHENGDHGGTTCRKRGTGNFYARQHMALQFFTENFAEDIGKCVAREMEKED